MQLPVSSRDRPILAKFPQYQSVFSLIYVIVCCTECKVDSCQRCDPKDPKRCSKCNPGYTLFETDKCRKGSIDISLHFTLQFYLMYNHIERILG